MPLTQVEIELRLRARSLIGLGQLPCAPKQTYGGYGTVHKCALCEQPVESTDVEYEVVDADSRVYRFHLLCHAAWQLECARKLHLSKSG